MPSPKQVTAIFDIGKTNKKFLLFDENYVVVEKFQAELDQTVDDDGELCEDLEMLEAWIRDQLNSAQKKVQIQALNFSGYGASLIHLNEKGEPVTPLYNYLKEYPKDLLKQFYESVGGREKFSIETASPPMGMLNSGLQIYWLKHHKPERFQQVERSLHFPNYLSYLFTGRETSELTSIGCHTGLWDFEKMNYHQWVKEENILRLLPSPKPVAEITRTENGIRVGPGIHDSSAALAPYLIGMREPFMMVSTGTWSITMNPFNDEPLTFEELERDCLCYLDISGNRVKASRFFLGAEYSHQKKKIEQFFNVSIDKKESVLDRSLMIELIQKKTSQRQLKLEKSHHSGPFPKKEPGNWQLSHFSSANEAYHQLILDLVAIQAESIKLAEGTGKTEKLIVTGGFSQNTTFVSLLASYFPEKEVYTSLLPDASALGAAMVLNEKAVIASGVTQAHVSHNNSDSGIASQARNDRKELLGLHSVKSIAGLNITQYSWFR